MPKETIEAKDVEYKKLEDDWWNKEDWIIPEYDEDGEEFEDKEPRVYQLIHDFVINKVIPSPKCVELSGRYVSRVITMEVEHPDRPGENEYARILLSPTDIADGVPDAEPDLVIHIDYYDLVRALRGELNLMAPLMAGRGYLLGNITAAIDLQDMMDAANGKEVVERPDCWPRGHP
ncbi:MAG: hypothetical protein GF329_04865 [Candidatus Lokiarchaeota archaeon]|nr:hypothetical protein [Candidatus Lokiarchaeota archaeon]